MKKEELFHEIIKRIGEFAEMDVSHLTAESRIAISFPDLDSLQLVEMLVYLEETIGVTIDENVMDKFETIGDLVEYIYEKQEQKSLNA